RERAEFLTSPPASSPRCGTLRLRRRRKVLLFELREYCTLANFVALGVNVPIFHVADKVVVGADRGGGKVARLDPLIQFCLRHDVKSGVLGWRQVELMSIFVFHAGGYEPVRQKVDLLGCSERCAFR